MSPVRVLLVDDQALFREALAMLLGVREEVEVVGEAGDGDEALRRVAALAPDVVLMDLHMPVLNGIAATRRLHVEHPAVRQPYARVLKRAHERLVEHGEAPRDAGATLGKLLAIAMIG